MTSHQDRDKGLDKNKRFQSACGNPNATRGKATKKSKCNKNAQNDYSLLENRFPK